MKNTKIILIILVIPFLLYIIGLWTSYIYYRNVDDFDSILYKANKNAEGLELILYSLECFSAFLLIPFVFYSASTLLIKMYSKHHFVFKSHWKVYTILACSFVFTSSLIFFFSFMNAEGIICQLTDGIEFLINNEFFLHSEHNYCTEIFDRLYKFDTQDEGIMITTCVEFLIGLIPITIFLFTNKPHDCFKCLGKDPDTSTYSIFQYSSK